MTTADSNTDSASIEALLQEIPQHPAVKNKFFNHIRQTPLSREELVRFGSQYYRWVEAFPKILAGLAFNVDNDDCRFEVTQILYSELGKGDKRAIHSRLLLDVFEALDISRDELLSIPAGPATTGLIDGLNTLYHDSSTPTALGAQLALEGMALHMITQLYDGFQHYRLSPKELSYFTLHLVEEKEHIDWAITAIENNRITQCVLGFKQCLDLIAAFWSATYVFVVDSGGTVT